MPGPGFGGRGGVKSKASEPRGVTEGGRKGYLREKAGVGRIQHVAVQCVTCIIPSP